MNGFVCPWCAGTFISRGALGRHWTENPQCAANRGVNNQTSTKYMSTDEQQHGPADHILDLVDQHAAEREAGIISIRMPVASCWNSR